MAQKAFRQLPVATLAVRHVVSNFYMAQYLHTGVALAIADYGTLDATP